MFVFRAMNTDVAVAAPALDPDEEQRLAERVAALFGETEQRFSRFRHRSELQCLNRATGPVTVSPAMMELLHAAGRHVVASGGVFDPTIGAALHAAGYDRSFAPGALDREAADPPPARVRFAEIVIDDAHRTVHRPAHIQLDFGGFLKGRTADRAAELAPGLAMIDAGGDAVLRGAGPDGAGWIVEVEDPRDPAATLVTLRLRDRAVATSAPNRRCWRTGARRAHHLIDPRTGAPSRSDLAQVTVVAPTAERADVLAKVAFLRGAGDGARTLDDCAGVGAVLVGADGALRLVGELEVVDA